MQHLGEWVIYHMLKELYFSQGAIVSRQNAPVSIFFNASVLSQETSLHPSGRGLPSLSRPL